MLFELLSRQINRKGGAVSADVIREYHEAHYAYKIRLAEELDKLEHVRDPGVRRARAELAVPSELNDRLREAVIAVDAMNHDHEERWIAAHEDMYGLRRGSAA
jgi:hypothetical protein